MVVLVWLVWLVDSTDLIMCFARLWGHETSTVLGSFVPSLPSLTSLTSFVSSLPSFLDFPDFFPDSLPSRTESEVADVINHE